MSRTRSCCERRAKGAGGQMVDRVTVRSSGGHRFLSGVWRCGNAWVCPVCAATMSTSRRLDIESAVSQHKMVGGTFALLTLTFPHTRDLPLKETLAKFQNAKRKLCQRKSWRDLKGDSVGTITTLEITYGDNGWHPHQHILLFVNQGSDVGSLKPDLYASWADCCEKVGLKRPSEAHGLDLRASTDGESYASYVEKEGNSWKLSNELTSVNKLGHKSSKTAFQILEDYVQNGHDRSASLFIEYAESVSGRAKHVWSPGLRAHFDIEDKTEEEEANPDNIKTEERELYDAGYLTPEGFNLITAYGAVGTFLDVCEDSSRLEVLFQKLMVFDGTSGKFIISDLYVAFEIVKGRC